MTARTNALVTLMMVCTPMAAFAYGNGIVGYSNKESVTCTACHGSPSATVATATITGPGSLTPGQTGTYQLRLTGGPAVKGGCDIAVGNTAATLSAGAGLAKTADELHHSSPASFSGGAVMWTFTLQAPPTAGTVQIFAAGNSTNGSGTSGDRVATVVYSVAVSAGNQPPTVASAAIASPATVTGTTTTLSTLGADDSGEAALTYTWTATTAPGQVTFSTNGTNAAKSTVATFSKGGAYVFTVTIRDAASASVTSTANVTVNVGVRSVSVAPVSVGVALGATQQFSVTAVDQFGAQVSPAPTANWAVSGGGSISSAGLFTAGGTAGGPYLVTASSGSAMSTASVTVADGNAPTIVTPANAGQSPVSGKTVTLNVLAADDGGEGALTYTWAAVAPIAPVNFSVNGTNAAKSTVTTFTTPGAYTFTVTVKDTTNLTKASTVNLTVDRTLTAMTVTPATKVLALNASQQFLAEGVDQFGVTLPNAAVSWATSGGGAIDASGLFQAGSTNGGPFVVTATNGTMRATATVSVSSGGAPRLAQAPRALPATVSGKSTALSVLGVDDEGEAALTYTWQANGPAAVGFSDSGSNSAKMTLAVFSKAGAYQLTVTVTDASGLSSAGTVDVVVNQVLDGVNVTPAAALVAPNSTQHFTATLVDQFGETYGGAMSPRWTAFGGTIDAEGVFTAQANFGGPFAVSAMAGGLRGNASVTIANDEAVLGGCSATSGVGSFMALLLVLTRRRRAVQMSRLRQGHQRPATVK